VSSSPLCGLEQPATTAADASARATTRIELGCLITHPLARVTRDDLSFLTVAILTRAG
jgi:hypothetical protein